MANQDGTRATDTPSSPEPREHWIYNANRDPFDTPNYASYGCVCRMSFGDDERAARQHVWENTPKLLDLHLGGNARMEELRQQKPEPVRYVRDRVVEDGWPTGEEVLELWLTFKEASDYVGTTPTIVEFGQWLSATGPFGESGRKPAEVVW